MKNKKYLAGLALLPFLAFCTKDDVVTPAFDVTVEAREYKVNDSVRFIIKDAPDVITFYSGEKNKEYKYKDRVVVEGRKKELSINTQVTYGSQTDNLKLMVSNDFTGTYDEASVKKASWKDITSKFTLSVSPAGVLGPKVSSGKVDITDELVAGKPVFFGFKFVGAASPGTTSTQRGWRIYNFDLTTTDPDGTSTVLASRTNAGWNPVNILDAVSAAGTSKWIYTTDMFYYDPMSSLVESEGWYITKGFLPDNMSPDKGTPIKDYTQRRNTYAYAFKAEGEYTVTFVGSNVNYTGEKSVIKEFKIKVVK
ncbi:DUF5017 domain-containing protein [Pedobacter africanus]|uniref:DUF5017 domain-containing protein n=1 Tax=Pedobacter africanus TaxID=151894 RepID=A0A1W1Z5G5_9SPHI|nr:DUF5017 domain-containing protein [Pedobacter africanus]SMC43689.1 protein of unknown function [Pedobacter africanus]